MKKLILVLAFVACVGAVAAAQDYIYAFRFAYVDIPVPAPPCAVVDSVTTMVYDRSAWLVFTCVDGRVILRRYFNPNDNGIAPQPVYTVPAPGSAQPLVVEPPAISCTQYPGFVPTADHTGCVPPDHPLARR